MTFRTLVLSGIAAVAFAGVAHAGNGNYASIEQVGTPFTGTGTDYSAGTGAGTIATIDQTGNSNSATSYQRARIGAVVGA